MAGGATEDQADAARWRASLNLSMQLQLQRLPLSGLRGLATCFKQSDMKDNGNANQAAFIIFRGMRYQCCPISWLERSGQCRSKLRASDLCASDLCASPLRSRTQL